MLPDDVLGVIRDFSRPRMRFYKEYRQGLTELGFQRDEHWHALRDKLCMSDAESVLEAFLLYKETTVALKQFNKNDWKGTYSVYFAKLENLISIQTKMESKLESILDPPVLRLVSCS